MRNLLLLIRWRLIILLTLGLFCLSTGFLLTASTAPARIEAGQVTPLGLLDVATAFLVIILGIVIYGKGMKWVNLPLLHNSYIVATVLPALVLAAIWLLLGIIRWIDVLLPGLAWRVYILLQTIPPALALWNHTESTTA